MSKIKVGDKVRLTDVGKALAGLVEPEAPEQNVFEVVFASSDHSVLLHMGPGFEGHSGQFATMQYSGWQCPLEYQGECWWVSLKLLQVVEEVENNG